MPEPVGRCTCDPDTYEPHMSWCGVTSASRDEPDVTLARADVTALLGLLIWVHDSILRQPDNDALIRRVGAAMGRAL